MNHNLFKYSLDPSQWHWSIVTQARAPDLTPPNFSTFSAPPDKPFLPQFGPNDAGPSQNTTGARKRRNDSLSGLDNEARQRKVFISEERMLDHLQRLNLDQGPDILQDLTPDAETHSLSGASEFSEPNPSTEAEVDAASSVASDEDDIDNDDAVGDSKVVLSDALKKFMDRKPEVLPDGVLKQIANKPMGNPSRALVLWRPPGEQIRDVIRNSLARLEAENELSVVMEDAIVSDPPLPALPPSPSCSLPFNLAPKSPDVPLHSSEETPLRPLGCLPDLLIDQPVCSRPSINFTPLSTASNGLLPSDNGWSLEQMET